ncbi:MAG TPA: hypothetical protein VH478_10305 [Trebonia sp.]|nr:hypothetical protein [Trebonia sp.]
MPPVSVTMQARKLPPLDEELALPVAAGALVDVPVPDELPADALDELLPQAASKMTAAALAAPASSLVCRTVLLHWTKG